MRAPPAYVGTRPPQTTHIAPSGTSILQPDPWRYDMGGPQLVLDVALQAKVPGEAARCSLWLRAKFIWATGRLKLPFPFVIEFIFVRHSYVLQLFLSSLKNSTEMNYPAASHGVSKTRQRHYTISKQALGYGPAGQSIQCTRLKGRRQVQG